MKKLMILAVCVMAVMMGCKNKGKAEAAADSKDSVAAVLDSIIEENDTTPPPMFLMGQDEQYMQMLYWAQLEEPVANDDNGDWIAESIKLWKLQEAFRRNKTAYTNMLVDGRIVKVKYIDEVLKDPDGNTPSTGERHSREGIPSLCARFDYANPKERERDELGYIQNGMVIVTDSYLESRKMLPIKFDDSERENPKPLPEAAVKSLEQKYGMKVDRMRLTSTINGRYVWGHLQFKGEYKNAPKNPDNPDGKRALALDVLIDGDKVYAYEEVGWLDEYGPTWNAEDEGQYVGAYILAAFEGPKGLELCFGRDAVESSAVGMFYLRGGQLIQLIYETYQYLADEEIPVWKRDIAEMQRIFTEAPESDHNVKFSKWAHVYIDYDNEWIWLRDKADQNGAIFIRKDGKFRLVATETPKMKFSVAEKGNTHYLKVSGSAGGPSYFTEIFAFENGKQTEHAYVLEVYGEVSEFSLNGRELDAEQAKAYKERLPEFEALNAYFTDIEE